MSTPGRTAAANRLVVVSYNGRSRRFDLDEDGRLSFAHVARVFRIPRTAVDDCDSWTLDDTSLRIDKSDKGALLTVSALRDLFPLPSGTAEHPLVLKTDESDGTSNPPDTTPGRHPRRQSKGGGGTPSRGNRSARSPAIPAAAAGQSAPRSAVASPVTRSAAAVAAAGTPRMQRTGGGAGGMSPAGFHTPGAASPLRGVRTPVGMGAGTALLPPRASPQPGPSTRAIRRLLPSLQLEVTLQMAADSGLLKHPKGQGSFFFSPAAAQQLPMLMACHLPPPLQRLLRCFSEAAQCVITARAMALYACTSEAEYFRDQKLEAALTEARSRNPPQDRFCAYTQSVRLTGRKRKPAASPHPGGGSTTPQPTRGSSTAAVAAAVASTDVDMDAGGWTFAGGGTLHCPGGVACKKAGRHENWLLSDADNQLITYLPVLYDSEEHSAVLLPLTDSAASAGLLVEGGGAGTGAAGASCAAAAPPLVWFRYEYESRGGRRGQNFWDRGLSEHLEQAVRDVAGEEALRLARGA